MTLKNDCQGARGHMSDVGLLQVLDKKTTLQDILDRYFDSTGGYFVVKDQTRSAETLIGPARESFNVVDKRWKIYKKE